MKIISSFFVFWVLIMLGIVVFRELTKKERWTLIKTLAFSAGCAILAFLVLTTIVILF